MTLPTSSLSEKTAVLTGGTGFVGAALVKHLLARGAAVHLLVRPESNLWRIKDMERRLTIHVIEDFSRSRIAKVFKTISPHVVFHLAQYGGYPFQKDPGQTFSTNITLAVNLLGAVSVSSCRRVVFTSSSSEYGHCTEPMREDMRLAPETLYAATKAAAAEFALDLPNRAPTISVAAVRLFSIYGPFEEPGRLIPTLVARAVAGRDLEISSPQTVRDFVYVDDAAAAIAAAAEAEFAGGLVANVCSGEQTTLVRVAEEVIRAVGSSSKLVYNQALARGFDTTTWLGDPTLCKRLIGWEATTTLAEGIRKTLEWYRTNPDVHQLYTTS